ncbi:transposase family protein [Kordiimonas aestuarii]|uniref:transposase family protein n=1 Tax=Kordiimonas aestuarii TaxID=1005925 RepID=UPI0021D1D396|nr:transposase family protein [Kordiimonas aestuarii]
MLQVNQIVEIGESYHRVLWSSPHTLILIDINDTKAFPVPHDDPESLLHLIASEDVRVADDPHLSLTMATVEAGSKAEEIRDRGWRIISDLVNDPSILSPQSRGPLVELAVQKHSTTKQTVYRLLRRYWQRGMTQNALLPDYHKSGGAGRKRKQITKLGRPRVVLVGIGCVITPDVERLCRIAIEEVFLKKKGRSLKKAYLKLLNLYKASFGDVPSHEVPTYRQLSHFYRREYHPTEALIKRTPKHVFNKDIRPLISTSTVETLGPGSRFQIDATIADVYLVSAANKRRIVGRPVVYIIIDVFSRLVVGVYIGFEGPSYVSAMQGLANAAENKVEYCKRFDIEISPDQWPVAGIPDAILADRGELLGHQIEALVSRFNVRVENAAAYRGDAKGIVERYFRTVQEQFKPYVEGVVEGPISKKRGGKDYRLSANLTIDAFTRIILHSVIWHNQNRVIEDYDRDVDMPDDLPSIPIELWKWGLANKTGRLRSFPHETVALSLLPRKRATISDLGINLFGLFYTCKEALAAGWFHRANTGRPGSVMASYDPRRANQIYILPEGNPTNYWVCDLSDRSRRFRDMNFWEVWRKQKSERATQAKAKADANMSEADLDATIEEIARDAQEKRPKSTGESKAARTRNIRENRTAEKDLERAATAFAPPKRSKPKSANVVPLKTDPSCSDFRFPDMVETLFGDDADDE